MQAVVDRRKKLTSLKIDLCSTENSNQFFRCAEGESAFFKKFDFHLRLLLLRVCNPFGSRLIVCFRKKLASISL